MTRAIQTAVLACFVASALLGCATQTSVADNALAEPGTAAGAVVSSTTRTDAAQSQGQGQVPSADSNKPLEVLQPIAPMQASGQMVAPLSAPADLWERIRRGYAMPNLDSELVKDREQYFASRPDYIARMTERSRKYLFHIVEELERRNMPSELALLPFIESAFNPQAVSSAKAAGMWQFMPATGKHFELKQNAFRDDRRDVLASTRAALDYLQKLYGMFGDWHLALAAYNWGEGSVGRAIAKNKKAGLGTGYLDLSMPAETRQYVPKLQAVKNIVSAPDAFKSTLPLIENHPFFQSVAIDRDIDVALAAKLADVSIEDFKALNPSANRPVILAAGTPQILLPWDQAEVFRRNLVAHKSGRLATWTVWTAPSNMKTADAARQTGMSEEELRAVNHIPPRSIIRAGSTLVVHRSQRIEHDVALAVADNGQVAISPEILARRTVVKAGKGDSVASLAKRYRLTAASVAEWNKVSAGASLAKGQQVVLYLPTKMARASSATAKSRNTAAVKQIRRTGSRSTKLATK
jgi:membrane-bound lytic murein transglycosylase D